MGMNGWLSGHLCTVAWRGLHTPGMWIVRCFRAIGQMAGREELHTGVLISC
jgi:hypothetical protein